MSVLAGGGEWTGKEWKCVSKTNSIYMIFFVYLIKVFDVNMNNVSNFYLIVDAQMFVMAFFK